jgi:plasmid stability protein
MAQVLVRDLDDTVVEALKQRAATNGRSLQAELKAILEEQAQMADKAAARALAARICQRIAARPQTDSGALQAEDRQR